jgi:hypothetical protein
MSSLKLPERVLRLINEYSKPLTHPNWKKLNIMPKSYFSRITHNARPNKVLRKFIQDYPYRISEFSFKIYPGQSYLYKRIKYTITDISPNYKITIMDSFGNTYDGSLYIYYKDHLYNGCLKRMEGVYIISEKNVYLNQTNYIHIY